METAPLIPQNIEAEKAVLGAILVNNDRFLDVSEILWGDDFARRAHQLIFSAMTTLVRDRMAIDFVTLRDRLTRQGQLDEIGGPVYLLNLADAVPHSTNAVYYATVVREHADRARLRAAGMAIVESAGDFDRSAQELMTEAEHSIFSVSERRLQGGGLQEPASLGTSILGHLEILAQRKSPITGVSTGFSELDDMTRGLQPGLILIGARPSMGKTALALQLAWHAARVRTVAFFSIEMSANELLVRLVSAEARINGHRLAGGDVLDHEYSRIGEACSRIGLSGLHVDDSSVLTIGDLAGRSKRLKLKNGGLGLVVVDYLQLMKLPKAENRNLAIGDVTRALKLLAKDLQVPVVVLSQLSRDPEKRGGDRRPMLSDLRDSGALEQDADLVMLLHRPEVYDSSKPELIGLAQLIIAKHRNGPQGLIELDWIARETRFADRS
jgi:replicative DNA helicase